MTAVDLLTRRFTALQRGDFATVYTTYHPEAPFLRQFADRTSYQRFAEQQLSAIEVVSWRSLRQREIDAAQQEHLLVMELAVAGARQYFYELALLLRTAAGWRYHSAQKLSAEDYAGPPEAIDFVHFDQADERLRY